MQAIDRKAVDEVRVLGFESLGAPLEPALNPEALEEVLEVSRRTPGGAAHAGH